LLPRGLSELTTGIDQLQSSTGQSGGNSVLAEAVLGGLGALLVLAVVFASALAVLPLIMAIVAIPTTFLLLLGLTELTTVNFVVQFLIGRYSRRAVLGASSQPLPRAVRRVLAISKCCLDGVRMMRWRASVVPYAVRGLRAVAAYGAARDAVRW
jgi:hypothetical protein